MRQGSTSSLVRRSRSRKVTASALALALAVALSLAFLWFGVYSVLAPAQAGSTLCGSIDLPWFLAGVLLNLVADGIALITLRARWWTLGIAMPGITAVVVPMLLPCSFVLPLVLPVTALISIASAVVVVFLAVRGVKSVPPAEDGRLSDYPESRTPTTAGEDSIS